MIPLIILKIHQIKLGKISFKRNKCLLSQPFDFFFISSINGLVLLPTELSIKGNQIWPEKVPKIFAEILYNSNRDNKVDAIRITHNSNKGIGNSRIVWTSSNPSINAYMTSYCVMRITSGCSWMPINWGIISININIINYHQYHQLRITWYNKVIVIDEKDFIPSRVI